MQIQNLAVYEIVSLLLFGEVIIFNVKGFDISNVKANFPEARTKNFIQENNKISENITPKNLFTFFYDEIFSSRDQNKEEGKWNEGHGAETRVNVKLDSVMVPKITKHNKNFIKKML